MDDEQSLEGLANGAQSREELDFRLLYETAPMAFLVLASDRPRFTIVAVSDAYLRATKTSREIVGRGIFEVFPDDPDDPESTGSPARASFEHVLQTGAPDTMAVQKHSIRRPAAEGGGFEERYWSPVNTPVLGPDGNVRYIHHRVEDVTEFVRQKQKRAQQEATVDELRTRAGEMEADVLRRAHEIQDANRRLLEAYAQLAELERGKDAQLRHLYDSGMLGVLHFDLDGGIGEANDKFLSMVGYTREDLAAGRVAWDRMTPAEYRAADEHAISELKRSGVETPYAKEFVRKDGTRVAVIVGAATYDVERHRGIAFVLDITDRKRAEDALRDSEERFRSVVENMSEGLMLFDANANLVYQNFASLRIHGFDAEENGRIGRERLPVTWNAWDEHGEPIAFEQWPVSRVFRGERFQNQVLRVQRVETGQVFYGSYNGSPIRDESGKLVLGFITIRDITEQVRAEEALRAAERGYRSLAENAPEVIARFDRQQRHTYVNEYGAKVYGVPVPEVIGKTNAELGMPPDKVAFWRQHFEAVFASGEQRTVEFEFESPTFGTQFFSSLFVPERDEQGKVASILTITRDVSSSKRAEEALRASEERWNAAIENFSEGAIIATEAEEVIYWNPAARAMHGFKSEREGIEPLAKTPETFELWTPDGEHLLMLDEWPMRRIKRGEKVHRLELRLRRPDQGWERFVSYSGAMVHTTTGQRLIFLSVSDLTEQRKAELALREADRRKDEFLGMLSHELRNPLAPIRNSLYILDYAEPTGQQARRAMEVLNRQVAHLTRLVDDLLDVTRIARGKIELRRARLDLAALVRRTAEDYRAVMRERGVELAVAVPDDVVTVDGDETRLAQVLGNLLSNAAKFTPSGGRVTVGLQRTGDRAVIRVRDTGVGIDPNLLPTSFDPFTQATQTLARSQGGLGLGLALVKGLAELHGGRAWAASDGPGAGTELVVELPAADAIHSSSRAAREAASSRPHRVLVVDDNHDAADSLADLIRLLGHEVEVAYDGRSAVGKFEATRPDIVLCDIGLPGMDGYAVARALRAKLGHTFRLVAVSGYALPEDVQKSAAAGFDAHIAKPPDPERIGRLFTTRPSDAERGGRASC